MPYQPCLGCVFFHHDEYLHEPGWGECQRHPPQLVVKQSNHPVGKVVVASERPQVAETRGCGDGEPTSGHFDLAGRLVASTVTISAPGSNSP